MRNDPLIPNIAVVTDIRVDTPDVKTFRVASSRWGGVTFRRTFLPAWNSPEA